MKVAIYGRPLTPTLSRLQTHLFLLGCLFSFPIRPPAQTSRAGQNSTDALPIVSRALGAMGGEAWGKVGAATATVTSQSSQSVNDTVQWATDWSTETVHLLRDPSGTVPKKRAFRLTDGSVNPLIPAYDLASLALAYPAVSLRLAMSRHECTFSVITPVPGVLKEEVGAIRQSCGSSLTGEGPTVLTWWFDPNTGLPSAVRIPTVGVPWRSGMRTIKFLGFEKVQGLLTPQKIEIAFTSKREVFALTGTQFAASLAADTFATK